jgi:hypothetical protein
MPLQGTEHWRSYIKTACDIGLPVMLFIQVIHKAGSISQVPVSDAHQGQAELQAGDGVVWTSLGPLPRWVPGPTTRWAPGTTRLALHGT